MTESWIQAFMNAVSVAEERELRVTQLSESAAQGLLRWCLDGPDRTGASGSGSKLTARCYCGEVAHVPALERDVPAENNGDPTSAMWLCPAHRRVMQGIMGTPGSPGRPTEKSPSQQRIDRYRRLSAGMRARRTSQAPAPEPPRPWTPAPPKPEAPRMPRPGV